MSRGNNNLIAEIRTALNGGRPNQAVWLLGRIRGEARIIAIEYVWGHLGSARLVSSLMGEGGSGWFKHSGGSFTPKEREFVVSLLQEDQTLDPEERADAQSWIRGEITKKSAKSWGW